MARFTIECSFSGPGESFRTSTGCNDGEPRAGTERKVNRMSEDKFDGMGPKMSAIGEEAAADVGGDPNGIYLYVEVGDRWKREFV